MKNIEVSKDRTFVINLKASDIQVLFDGLDELKHKVAKPVEILLMQQMAAQLEGEDG